MVGLLQEPLVEGEYEVRVSSLVNINGLPGGGGEVVLAYEPPAPPADSTATDDDGAAAPDSAAVGDPADAPGAPGPAR